MQKYSHKRSFSLRYSDTDFQDEIKPSCLLALLQECACTSADELGFGYDYLRPQGLGFIVVSTYCEYVKPMPLGALLTVETWPLPPRHVIFERDYRITDEQGETCANAASRWCLVDLNDFSLCKPERLSMHATCPYRAENSCAPQFKIVKLNGSGREAYRTTVKNSVCDHYMHANNCRYADFFFDCFTMDELSSRKIKCFSVSYHKQAKEGQELVFYRADEGDCTVLECRSGEELYAQFSVTFQGK